MARSTCSGALTLLVLMGCGDDSIRDVRGIWSGDGSDRIAVVVQRYDTRADPTFGDVGRELAENHSWELWTMNQGGSEIVRVAEAVGIPARTFVSQDADYVAMLLYTTVQRPVVFDLASDEVTFAETGNLAVAWVPSASGTVIALVERLLPGAANTEAITETYAYRLAVLDSASLEVVAESFLGLDVSFARSGWVSEDEFRYGTIAMFTDGRVERDVSEVSEACHQAATPGSEINRDGQRLVVDYDGDDFEIDVVSDGLPWPERCTP